jgi:phage/plasmid-associated DNA primase
MPDQRFSVAMIAATPAAVRYHHARMTEHAPAESLAPLLLAVIDASRQFEQSIETTLREWAREQEIRETYITAAHLAADEERQIALAKTVQLARAECIAYQQTYRDAKRYATDASNIIAFCATARDYTLDTMVSTRNDMQRRLSEATAWAYIAEWPAGMANDINHAWAQIVEDYASLVGPYYHL